MVQYSGINGAYSPQKQTWSIKILFFMLGSMIGFLFRTIKHSLLPTSPEKIITQVSTPPKGLSFTCFSRLPPEIRSKIWQSAFEGRTVTLHVHSANQCCYSRSLIPREIKITLGLVQAKMPKTLWVNRESREVTLIQYKDLIQNPALFRDPVYFNSDLDAMALEVYYPTRPGKDRSWVRQRGARNQQKISLDLRDLEERTEYSKMVKSLYLPMIMLEDESAATYNGPIPTCWSGMAKFHALELVTITGVESDFEYGLPVAFAKSAARLFHSSFEKEKRQFPECQIPRLNMFPLDMEKEKATGLNDYFQFAGNALFEDDVVGGSWTLWFRESEDYSKVDSSKEGRDGAFVEESIQVLDASKDKENRRNHTGRISEAANDGVTVASEFNNSRWSTEDEEEIDYLPGNLLL
ncbi:hypothetical protein EAE96_005210 [Botrytis aclada]|nr:hypothetical protein EAE96_005210 [Botrytis aclada]